ncbi:MAG: hypothetical protein AB7V62_01850 [Thermoleophilia bacterium]
MSSPLIHRARVAVAVLAAIVAVLAVVTAAGAEQASSVTRTVQGGYLDVGDEHTCAVLGDRTVRCWGRGLAGRLGYGTEANVMNAAAAAPVDVGAGRTVRAVTAGDFHTCAILDDGTVRCWGFGANGRLGYGGTGDVRSPATAPAVDIGPGRRAVAITAGASHTCAIRDDGSVICWGNGVSGRLGYGNQSSIGDNETAAAGGPVDIGAGRRAVAITAGDFHTCVIRDDGALVCWGFGSGGQLGRGGTSDIGDNETPGQAGPVDLGGRRARAVSGGKGHTCAILDDGSARCWGFGADGRLGYGSESNITSAAAAPAIDLGPGRTAVAIGSGEAHSCAILDSGSVRCWGFGGNGRLGYGATDSIGDDPGEQPGGSGPVSLGPGRTARTLSVGYSHTCASLDDGTVRCWGFGGSGRLGYGNETSVGDSPARSVATAGPVPVPGAVPPLVADLSVAMGLSAGQVEVGASATVGVTVVNSGVDAASGVVLSVPAPAGVGFGGVTATQGSFEAGAWQVGSLAPGATASLQLAATPTVSATHTISAEVTGSGVHDPDSTPANGAAEDDRAVVALVAPGVAATPPTTLRLLPRRLAMKAVRKPKRGRARTITVTGSLLLPRGLPASRCSGRVRVMAKVGKRTVAQRTVALKRVKRACRYGTVLRPKRTRAAKRVVVSARFLGTAQMRPRASKAVKVRIR